jgi:hypothetical protein
MKQMAKHVDFSRHNKQQQFQAKSLRASDPHSFIPKGDNSTSLKPAHAKLCKVALRHSLLLISISAGGWLLLRGAADAATPSISSSMCPWFMSHDVLMRLLV